MDNEFLQSFLKTGLFEIGDSDDRLEKLRKSIADLQKKFEGDYSLLPKYTLAAIDPNILDSEPALLETENILTVHWETLRSKHPEMPRNILRGVILNAINNVGNSDPIAARIIFLTALNIYPYLELGKEKEVIESMLIKLGDLAEKNAIEEWSFIENAPSVKIGTLKTTGLKINEVTVDDTNLKEALKVAAKYTPQGYNQYQQPEQWSEHFSNNVSPAISELIKNSIASISNSFDSASFDASINKFFLEFKKSLDANLKTSFSSLTSVERRSKLLWWKETLYSSSLRKSYRGLDKTLLPLVMGFDLNNQIPKVTPISVDYLLRDTIFSLSEKKDDLIKFSDFLSAISQKNEKEILKPFFTEFNEDEGRISITDFITLLINDRLSINDFQKRTGIKEKEETSISEIAVTILHDLLILRLIKE